MYYSSGNYEAFARPKKPADVDNKHAYIIGTGLAALSAACYLVRDGQMPDENIHILEKDPVPGGACDGLDIPGLGYVMRGGREMDNHFEVMWDLFRSIPSIETEGVSVLDEYYWLNKEDPNYSLCRATKNLGKDAGLKGKFGLSDKASMEIMKLFFTPDEDLYDKPITDFFDDEVLNSNFWLYWRTMFAFENWHSALEMKLYIKRYIHHIGGLPDFSALRFTRYNQYESMILPMCKYITDHGGKVLFDTTVTNIVCDCTEDKKVAKKIEYTQGGVEKVIELTENDLVICTNGCQGDASAYGDQTHAPVIKVKNGEGPSIEMWKKLAAQDPAFGHPEKFFKDIKETSWESWTVDTANKQILDAIQKICKRDPLSGKVVTGGIVTCRDSSWLVSWTINRQGQFQEQPKDHCLIWVYGLNCWDDKGDFIKKNMCDCTGIELAAEWLYHIGIPEDQIMDLATNECNTTPCMMPYVTTFFEPRAEGDRPKVVPDGSVNLAFVGQFADTPRDTVFTTEYSIRTAMEAVYTLCNVDRGVPEVWGSVYDIRDLLYATSKLLDGKKPLEFLLPSVLPLLDLVKEPLVNNVVVDLLKKYNIV